MLCLFQSLLPVIDGHFPAGTSVWTPVHYGQLYNARNIFIPPPQKKMQIRFTLTKNKLFL